jgi:hypothetical protein
LQGGQPPNNNDEIWTDGVYFSNQIFGALIGEVEACVARFAKSTLTHHGNYFRRGARLIKIGKTLEQSDLCDTSSEFHTPPLPEVYEYLEEIIPFFVDIEEPEIAAMIEDLVISEVISEVITVLAIRPGRQTSAAVLAVHYGLADAEDADQMLEHSGVDRGHLQNYLYAAHLDIDEIAQELRYPGDYKTILDRAKKRLAA